jgi:hypothetical protein
MTALPSPAMTDDKDIMLNFRARQSDVDAIDAAAARCDMTRSEWIREVLRAAADHAGHAELEGAKKRARRRFRKST